MALRNDKLIRQLQIAFYDEDYDKIEKYLKRGANPNIDENKLYKYAVSNDNLPLLQLLLKYDESCLTSDKSIINTACAYNSINCLRFLCDLIKADDYKRTATYTRLQQFI